MANKYLEKIAGMADLLGKAKGMAQTVGKSVTRNARSLADDAKTAVNPGNKSRAFALKAMGRNPITQIAGGVAAGTALKAGLSRRKDDK